MRRFLDYNKKLKTRAKELRRNMTAPEKKLWFEFLRDLRVQSHSISLEEQKSPSIPLNKGEETQEVPLTKGEASESEQGD